MNLFSCHILLFSEMMLSWEFEENIIHTPLFFRQVTPYLFWMDISYSVLLWIGVYQWFNSFKLICQVKLEWLWKIWIIDLHWLYSVAVTLSKYPALARWPNLSGAPNLFLVSRVPFPNQYHLLGYKVVAYYTVTSNAYSKQSPVILLSRNLEVYWWIFDVIFFIVQLCKIKRL